MTKRKIIIIFSLLLLCVLASLWAYYHCDCEIVRNLLLGIIASSVTVIILEIIDWFYDFVQFSYLKGSYRRIKIEKGLDKRNEKTDTKYEDITNDYKNVNPRIKLKYKGSGQYTGNLDYNEGRAEFVLNLNKENKYIGNGIYYYLFKHDNYKQKMPDQGEYEIVVEKSKPIRIYVYYNNLIPSKLAWGYEIWEKI